MPERSPEAKARRAERARPAREPATLGVPEWYIRTVYAESCGAPGTDEYARGVEEFQQYKRQAQADFLLVMARYMRTHWDAGGTIRDPQDPETSYSADRWMEVCAERLRDGGKL